MAMRNKKIKNALPKEYDGIKFKSKFEVEAYKKLKENGFLPIYEGEKAILFNGFHPDRPWYQDGEPVLTPNGKIKKLLDWNYSPDFKLSINDFDVYIEIKGFPNDVYPYKRKMFLQQINGKKALFFEVKDMNGLLKTIERLKDVTTFV